MNNYDMLPGRVVVFANPGAKLFSKDWYTAAQHILTRMKFNHTALGFFKFDGHDEDTLFEAKEAQSVTPWDKDNIEEYYIFQIKWYTQQEIETALWNLYKEFAGKPYAYLQLLYFVVRYIWETKWVVKYFGWLPRLFGKSSNVRLWNNWFVSGTICSELFYRFMEHLVKIRFNKELNDELNNWNANNFHAGDSYTFMTNVTSVFDMIYHKEYTGK